MAIAQPQRRRWRYDDLFDLPADGKRYEIIDGELFELPAPGWEHAVTIANLFFLLGPVARALGGRIVAAPVDVFLPGGDPVQPDIVILLPDRLAFAAHRGVEGPPSILIEVVSPSNSGHDQVTKRALYARGGVLECWLVEPLGGVIEVLVRSGDAYMTHIRAAAEAMVSSLVLPALSFPASDAFRGAAAPAR